MYQREEEYQEQQLEALLDIGISLQVKTMNQKYSSIVKKFPASWSAMYF